MQAIQHLTPGTPLTLANGDQAVVVDNPQDGAWIVIRRTSGATAGQQETEFCNVDDIASTGA